MRKKTGVYLSWKALTAIILAGVLLLSAPLQLYASTESIGYTRLLNGLTAANDSAAGTTGGVTGSAGGEETAAYYISDIKTATADSAAQASKMLRDAGYVVFDQNTNYGAEKGRVCLIGYKLTTDREEAITALHTMEMGGGYTFKDYRTFMSEHAKELDDLARGFMYACSRMKQLVADKNPLAVYAYNTLNIFCVPESMEETTGPGLGTYLINDLNTSVGKLKDLLMVLDTKTLSFINNLLACACAETYLNEEQLAESARVSDPGWLKRTIESAFKALSALSEEALSKIEVSREAEVREFRAMLSSTLNEVAVRYLSGTSVRKAYGGDEYNTAAAFLLESTEIVPLALFIDALPESIHIKNFAEVFNAFAEDEKIPKTLAPLPAVVSPWMQRFVNDFNGSSQNPFIRSEASGIVSQDPGTSADLEILGAEITCFIEEYRKQKTEFDKMLEESEGLSAEELMKAYTASLEADYYSREKEGKSTSDLVYFMGAYQVISKYFLDEKTWILMPDGTPCRDMGQFFELIADAKDMTTKNALTAMLARNLDEAGLYILKAAGVPIAILNGGISPDNAEFFEKQYQENITTVQAAYKEGGLGPNECTIWYNSNRDLLDCSSLAFTSDAVRASALSDNFKLSSASVGRQQAVIENIQNAMQIVGLAGAGAGVLWGAGSLALWFMGNAYAMTIGGLVKLGVGCVFGAEIASGIGVGGFIAAVSGAIGIIGTAITIIATIVLLILSSAYKIKDRDEIPYSKPPEILLDCALDVNETITSATRYDAVKDLATGMAADLNDMEKSGASRWIRLYYTHSTAAGSPLVLNNNHAFISKIGSSETPNKAVPVTKFGYTIAYNLNSYNNASEQSVFLFCYTENSVNGVLEGTDKGKYVCQLRLGIAATEEMAKAAILNLQGFNLFDQNLTPGGKYFTYLGYSTTNDIYSAAKDIRIKTGAVEPSISWGTAENVYFSFFDESHTQCPLRTAVPFDSNMKLIYMTEYLFQPYFSTSFNVGDPILADSLRIFGSLSERTGAYEDYTVVSTFAGGAYDFLTDTHPDYVVANSNHRFVGYKTDREALSKALSQKTGETPSGSTSAQTNTTEEQAETEPGVDWEQILASNETYISGIAFFSGTEYSETGWKSLEQYAEALGYRLLNVDLSGGALRQRNGFKDGTKYRKYGDFTEGGLYLAYSVSNDPKRALTDIGVFTGEVKGDGNLKGHIDRGNIAFESAPVYLQKAQIEPTVILIRKMATSNAYISKLSSLCTWFHNDEWKKIEDAGTALNPDPYTIRPRGLYTAGPQADAAPIRLSDLVYSTAAAGVPNSTFPQMNVGLISVATGQPAADFAGGGWKSVHAMEQFFFDQYDENGDLSAHGTNLGLSRDEANGKDGIFYLYYRNAYRTADGKLVKSNVPKRKAYIGRIEIVGSVNENSAYDMARYLGMAYGQEIVNLPNPLYTTEGERFNVYDENLLYREKDESVRQYKDKCYYLTVTYQNSQSGAVASVMLDFQDGNSELSGSFDRLWYEDPSGDESLNEWITYKKGGSVASTVPDPKPDENGNPGKKTTKYDRGYVLYTASHTNAAGRVLVLENNRLSDSSLLGSPRWYAEDSKGKIFSTDGMMGQSIALYGYNAKYIRSIKAMRVENGMTSLDVEMKLCQQGYTQLICTDILAGTSIDPIYIGIMRQDALTGALQDIKVVYEDLGPKAPINGANYYRVNDVSLTFSAQYPGLTPVFLYTTTGAKSAVREFGDRTALTNLGLCYTPGNTGNIETYYWNGMGINATPSTFKETTVPMNVLFYTPPEETGKEKEEEEIEEQLIEEFSEDYGYLNKPLFDYQVGMLNRTGSTLEAKAYKQNNGYTRLVYTNDCGYSHWDYSYYYEQGYVTGTAEGDAELGLASILSESPMIVPALALLSGAIVGGIMLIVIKRRKEQGRGEENRGGKRS